MARKTLAEILKGETRFGRLSVIGEADRRDNYRRAMCACECGARLEVLTFSLTSGRTVSCGCFHDEQQVAIASEIGRRNATHGESVKRTQEYSAWLAMQQRCNSPSHERYADYGGRGISVTHEWARFETFLADMGRKPSRRHTLERVDNSLGYGPDNCEWRQWEPQNRNRRNTVIVAWRGMQVPLAKLAARTKTSYGLLHRRIVRMGWDAERAIRTPSRQA